MPKKSAGNSTMSRLKYLQIAAALMLVAGIVSSASAEGVVTYDMKIKGTEFSPKQLKVKAGEAFRIRLINDNALPVEMESATLGFEKVAAGFAKIVVNVRAQQPGTYEFFDEFHPEAKGQVIVE
jgi:plastocyanin